MKKSLAGRACVGAGEGVHPEMPRGGPTKHEVLGALRPTMGNTVGLTIRFSGRYSVKVSERAKEFIRRSTRCLG